MKTGIVRKIRIAMIAIMALAVIAVLILGITGKKNYESKMLSASANVTIVESPEQDAAMEHEATLKAASSLNTGPVLFYRVETISAWSLVVYIVNMLKYSIKQ